MQKQPQRVQFTTVANRLRYPFDSQATFADSSGDADLDTLDKGLSDVERLKLLSEWHKEAADPDVQGQEIPSSSIHS
eukprot:2337543-Amphidinium_carterae.1